MTSPIAALRFETYVCSVERAPVVGSSPQTPSIRASTETGFPTSADEQREHRALLRAAQANVDAVAQDFEGPEDVNVQVGRTIRRGAGSD